jgi:hypothetical protein
MLKNKKILETDLWDHTRRDQPHDLNNVFVLGTSYPE